MISDLCLSCRTRHREVKVPVSVLLCYEMTLCVPALFLGTHYTANACREGRHELNHRLNILSLNPYSSG
jgi:hypothetical protein